MYYASERSVSHDASPASLFRVGHHGVWILTTVHGYEENTKDTPPKWADIDGRDCATSSQFSEGLSIGGPTERWNMI